MHPRLLAALLLSGFALLLVPLAGARPEPPSPYCAVQAASRPTITPGIYTVTLAVAKDCPSNGLSFVRLESYVGGMFPRDRWFELRPDQPLTRTGVPWYWRARVRSQSGVTSYPLLIPGMTSPFSSARPSR